MRPRVPLCARPPKRLTRTTPDEGAASVTNSVRLRFNCCSISLRHLVARRRNYGSTVAQRILRAPRRMGHRELKLRPALRRVSYLAFR